MPMEVNLDAVTRERLEEQSGLLLRIYEAEFAKDPASQATRNSRSNMIALRHSINQVYGEAIGILLKKIPPTKSGIWLKQVARLSTASANSVVSLGVIKVRPQRSDLPPSSYATRVHLVTWGTARCRSRCRT